jgi:hypothetical protein
LSAGQTIPSGFGELIPKKRWTVRFAVGVSFKAKDFSAFSSGSQPTVSQASPDSKPKNQQGGSPSATPPNPKP